MSIHDERIAAEERARVAALEARIAEFERLQQAWLMSPAAAKQLDGYRELAEKCAALERERDEARALASQPCDGIGCPQGEEAVRLAKQVARLREVLELALKSTRCRNTRCAHSWHPKARAALKETT